MFWAEDMPPAQICKAAIWDRLNSWEVVATVLLIVGAWATVQVARMFFMWKTATLGTQGNCCQHDIKGGTDGEA